MYAIFFDLDDTIYSESIYRQESLKEAAKWVASEGLVPPERVCSAFEDILSKKGYHYRYLFDDYCLTAGLGKENIHGMIKAFHSRCPALYPYDDWREFALWAKESNYYTGLITDGHPVYQRQKINSLKLDSIIDESSIIVTEEHFPSMDKNAPEPFLLAMEISKQAGENCMYIGDDPDKDFVWPLRLGWHSIRLKRGSKRHEKIRCEKILEVDRYDEIKEHLIRLTNNEK